MADQFKRASLSIALNIAEGNGRGTVPDKRRFLLMARGSTLECVPLIEMCKRNEILPPDTCAALRRELVGISKMLSGLMGSLTTPDGVKEDSVDYL